MSSFRNLVAAIVSVFFGMPIIAGEVEWVVLEPVQFAEARLVVVDPTGAETSYTPAEIEALGTFRMVTTTPWRPEPAVFEGGLLQDLLKRHGLDQVTAIRVVAENEFESILEREVWHASPVLLATRVDGKPHSRRARGPIQFVVSMDDYDGSDIIAERHLVWMAARIEPVN